MPVSKSLRSSGPIAGSLSSLSRALPDRTGRVPSLPPPRPPRRVERPAPLPPPPLVDEGARSDAADDESPPRALPRPPRAQTADQSETDAEASRAAFDTLRALLRKRGNDDPEVLNLEGWTATREPRLLSGAGRLGGWHYKFTDPDGETYKTVVEAACAAEPRAEGEEAPSFFEETCWLRARHARFAKLKTWERPAAVRDLAVPPPPDDPVPDVFGGFDAAYGDDWTRAKPHPQFVDDDVAAMGGDMDDERCWGPRTALAVACQAARMRPPVHRRNVTPAGWCDGLLQLADDEPDQAHRAALRELARVAKALDSDCRDAAKRDAEKNWPAARYKKMCVLILGTSNQLFLLFVSLM